MNFLKSNYYQGILREISFKAVAAKLVRRTFASLKKDSTSASQQLDVWGGQYNGRAVAPSFSLNRSKRKKVLMQYEQGGGGRGRGSRRAESTSNDQNKKKKEDHIIAQKAEEGAKNNTATNQPDLSHKKHASKNMNKEDQVRSNSTFKMRNGAELIDPIITQQAISQKSINQSSTDQEPLTDSASNNDSRSPAAEDTTATAAESTVPADPLVKLTKTSNSKVLLVGLTEPELRQVLQPIVDRPFRATQIFNAIHLKGFTSFESMSELGKDMRPTFAEIFTLETSKVINEQTSSDGTRKWLMEYDAVNNNKGKSGRAETVFIPNNLQKEEGKVAGTVCVSSQIGCSLACSFCHTGTQKMVRNLTAGEIIGQVLHVMRAVGEFPVTPGSTRRIVTNIVMMGQGEPLLNFANVAKAINLFSTGLHLSPFRTTLSTSGVAPLMGKVSREIGCGLAVSLHAITNDLRNHLVPLNKQYPISDVLDGVADYVSGMSPTSRHKRVTFEYVMLKGVNDSLVEARELGQMLARFPAHVNLIPFNPWPGSDYVCSDAEVMAKFRDVVKQHVPCTIRWPKGQDIMGACGQLKSASETKRRFALKP